MGKYIKLFEKHSDYEAFVNSGLLIKPNVSYCLDVDDVHYNPNVQPLIAIYNVESTAYPTQLYTYISQEGMIINGSIMFDNVKIDDVDVSIAELDTAQGTYQFTSGEHIIKYTLKDPTFIGIEVDGQTLSKIGASFLECPRLTSITIPNSVTTIKTYTFNNCVNLTNVTIPNSVTSIDELAFNGCENLTSITIPDSVTSIGIGAFQNCSSLTSITIPDSVSTISEYTFNGCSSLKNITIPDSVTTINESAFYNCDIITMTIGNGITSIKLLGNLFIDKLIINAITPPVLPDGIFFTPWMEGSEFVGFIQVPAESVNAYKNASGWSDYADLIQAIPTT